MKFRFLLLMLLISMQNFSFAQTSSTPLIQPAEASRFLSQASFGPKMSEIDSVVQQGIPSWIEGQFLLPTTSHQAYLDQLILALPPGENINQNQVFQSFWRQAITGQDQLRQRVAFALSEIMVISVEGVLSPIPRGVGAYMDVLNQNAFGNYRQLLEAVANNPMMGLYLSHLGNKKEDLTSGRMPDENFAREIMQLFSIGLYELNIDGTLKLNDMGQPMETYTNADVTGLAKVFTGWSWGGPDQTNSRFSGGTKDPDRDVIPMQNYPQFHSTSEKKFLGVVIPAGTSGPDSLRIALDRLFNHPNTGPFIGKQLIQRLVTSNPSPAYVKRVAEAFANNGAGVRGDMKAVIRAIFLDSEARNMTQINNPNFGKLREPIVRLANWIRPFAKPSNSGHYIIGNLDSQSTALSQTPMRSSSVFNFFRPGYVPPNTAIASQGLVAPEFQITNETSVVGYLNFMQNVAGGGVGGVFDGLRDVQIDYAPEIALALNPDALLARVELILAYQSLSASNRQLIRDAIASVQMPTTPESEIALAKLNRAKLAIFLVMSSPEYIVLR